MEGLAWLVGIPLAIVVLVWALSLCGGAKSAPDEARQPPLNCVLRGQARTKLYFFIVVKGLLRRTIGAPLTTIKIWFTISSAHRRQKCTSIRYKI